MQNIWSSKNLLIRVQLKYVCTNWNTAKYYVFSRNMFARKELLFFINF